MVTQTRAADEIELPLGLMREAEWLDNVAPGFPLTLTVPDDYEQKLAAAPDASEVLGIQRALTLARQGVRLEIRWASNIADKALRSPTLFPLLAVLLMLRPVKHSQRAREDGSVKELDPTPARKEILTHRLGGGFFVDCDLAVSAEGEGQSLSLDFYDPTTHRLRPREHFETLAVNALTSHLSTATDARTTYTRANLLGVILAELVENSDTHGRLDLGGRPIVLGGIRGLLLRRIRVSLPNSTSPPGHQKLKDVECFEVSIFDGGVGYYQSFTRNPLSDATSLDEEWKVLHNCLQRHYFEGIPDSRPGHRGMGLYEVLRALQSLKGRIEFRTGRLYAYRTFLEGELQAQMERRAPRAHLAWPLPRLLDVEKKYFAKPSRNELLVGSSVRILVPLA